MKAVVAAFTLAGVTCVSGASSAPPVSQIEELPLHAATRAEDLDEVVRLLRNRQDVDTTGDKGVTPLMIAAHVGSEPIVRLLLEAGAKVNAEDEFGNTALIEASMSGRNPKVVELLLKSGADVGGQGSYGITPLVGACITCNPEIVRMLLAAGANPDIAMKNGQTALIGAVSASSEEVVSLILGSSRRSINARNENGTSALDVARITGNASIRKMLIEAGARE